MYAKVNPLNLAKSEKVAEILIKHGAPIESERNPFLTHLEKASIHNITAFRIYFLLTETSKNYDIVSITFLLGLVLDTFYFQQYLF